MEVGDKFHVPAALPMRMTAYPLHRTLVGGREGLDMCGKTSPQTDSIPWPPGPWQVPITTTLSTTKIRYKIEEKFVQGFGRQIGR